MFIKNMYIIILKIIFYYKLTILYNVLIFENLIGVYI